jgi:hypothetical protein
MTAEMLTVRDRYTNLVRFEAPYETAAQFVRDARKAGHNLRGCRLSLLGNYMGADLSGIDFSGADLSYVHFDGAKLDFTCFDWAYLPDASFRGCDLRYTSFCGAYLKGVSFVGATLNPSFAASLSIVPDGDLIGWKKCRNNVVVKLRIPAEAKRSNAVGRKCRAEYAEVLELIPEVDVAYSLTIAGFKYVKGQVVRPTAAFDEDRWNECASGIHFFLTYQEASDFFQSF